MSLPPLANFLAVRSDDPRAADDLEREFRDDPRFDEVWRPWPSWIVGVKPLPGGTPDGVDTRAAGLVFAEGREAARAGIADGAQRVAALARDRPDRLAEVEGDFTFVAFHANGAATAVRAAAGLAPLYVSDDGAVIGTRLPWVASARSEPPVVDRLVAALFAHGYTIVPDGRTPLRGVRMVERGSYVGPRAGRYWDPRLDRQPLPDEETRAAHARRLREVLLAALETNLDPSGGNWLALSGGMDSSSLLCLAAGTLGLPVSAISMLPGSDRALALETPYFRSALGHAPVRDHLGFRMDERILVPHARHAVPAGFPYPHPVLQLVPHLASREGVTVYFGGEFGDEVGGSRFTISDWIAQTSLQRALAGPRPTGRRDVIEWVRQRARPVRGLSLPRAIPAWFEPELRREYEEWRERFSRRASADRRPRADLAARVELLEYTTMNWEACSVAGVRRLFPFISRAMLELAFACHPDELVGPGYRKLTRRALADDVPGLNLRTDKIPGGMANPDPIPFDGVLGRALEGIVRADLTATGAVIPPALVRRLWTIVRFAEPYGLSESSETAETAYSPHLDTLHYGP